MSMQQQLQNSATRAVGDFDNFPEITQKSRELLVARGINALFPVQYESFKHVWSRKDLIVRDLTGSGKTLGFSLPLVEWLRKNKTLGSGKI
jgi:ATP-dependent RNA helicase DDX21